MVRNAGAVKDFGFPALMEKQRKNATSQAILEYDKKFLQFRKQNEGKEVIIVSIAVTAEGLQPSGRNAGNSIMKELEQASLTSSAGMANLVRIVRYKGGTYYENPTTVEQRELGAPGELLFNTEGKQHEMHVEKVMQVYILHRGNTRHNRRRWRRRGGAGAGAGGKADGVLESYQMGTYVRTHYHKFPLSRVSLQARQNS